jgi:hypothetical protein
MGAELCELAYSDALHSSEVPGVGEHSEVAGRHGQNPALRLLSAKMHPSNRGSAQPAQIASVPRLPPSPAAFSFASFCLVSFYAFQTIFENSKNKLGAKASTLTQRCEANESIHSIGRRGRSQ